MKGVSEPDAETGVSLGEDPCYVIVSDKLSCMELSEYSLNEGLLNCLEVYLREPGKYAVVPIAVSQEPVKMRIKV